MKRRGENRHDLSGNIDQEYQDSAGGGDFHGVGRVPWIAVCFHGGYHHGAQYREHEAGNLAQRAQQGAGVSVRAGVGGILVYNAGIWFGGVYDVSFLFCPALSVGGME